MCHIDDSFNPYFNGYSTLTLENKNVELEEFESFNPYFNGYSTLTLMHFIYKIE